MKRINYLFALALPALMAACTQEELVTSDAGNNGLKLVENPIENFSLKVNIEDEVGTRMVGNKFEVGDEMGLVWFNASYNNGNNVVTGQTDNPNYYANNRMTISKNANGESVWTSDAVIMEGTHFAYLPFQTKWENQEDYPLQVEGGKEALQVYNETDQKDDANKRLYWAYNHATYLSPAYEFTAKDGTAGISDERRIDMRIFSNRLSFTPVFENAPADLTVYSYELTEAGNFNTHVTPFVNKEKILAHKLPKNSDFLGCNWATLNTTTKLGDFYEPVDFEESLTMTYANEVKASEAPQFMFLLLPATKSKIIKYGDANIKAGKLQLIAHTNYGDITIENVTGKFDANTTKVSEISLSQLYYNGEDISKTSSADTYVGFVDVAGTTRGATTGVNGAITATFDFNNITYTWPEVCNNETLERALDMIKKYQEMQGDACPKSFELQLCKQPVFTDLDFTGTLNDFMEETGLKITVTGYDTWKEEDGTSHTYSEITWKGNSKLDQVIAYTENFVADGATLTTTSEKNRIAKITVQDGGRLTNNGLANIVFVEEGGSATNNGTITTVYNYGTLTNAMAATAAADDQPIIEKLSNYNRVINYATLENVARNAKKDNTAATIELRDNTRKGALGTLGSIFKVNAKDAEDDKVLGIIKYDLDSATPTDAGTDLAHALNNYATQITVDAAVTKIEAPESAVFQNANSNPKNDFDRAQITFEGNTEYSIDNNTAKGSLLALGKIIVNEGVTLTVSNAYYTGNNSGATGSAYALVADELTMGNNATVDVKEITSVVANTLNIADGVTATVKTVAGTGMLSEFYYGTKFGNGTLTTSGNINTTVPSDIAKTYFK